MVNCPVCEAALDIDEDELDEGDEFTCDECGAELGVVSTDPLEIGSAADSEDEEEEDDDLDDDEDEEEDEDLDEDEKDDDWK